ncbi:MAG: chorismate lyase [Gammaproteobacteria bacterium]|jgi:chorismate--pyruvate lyase
MAALDTRATCWKPGRCFLRSSLPRGLSGWLLDTASLTLRLQRLCPGKFQVRVLSQTRAPAGIDEVRVLGMKQGSLAIIRQVHLLCDGQPWVYARTVIPVISLRGKLKRLAHLGVRPLGGLLFADPGMQRDAVELARIARGQPLYQAATCHLGQHPAAIWGRRSVFRLSGRPLLVSEVFLPDFPAVSPAAPCWKSAGMKL